MCFYQHDEVSNQVSVTKDTTNKRATVLNATGCQWMKYSGQASSSFSVAHVPMCVYRGAVSMSSMTATTDNNHGIIFTYLYKKKVFSLRKKTVLHFHCTVHQKTNKNTKRRCKLYSIPCFFSLPENTFHYCLFTLDRQANNLTMCQSHWT